MIKEYPLAIIIPAFKSKYLKLALNSLAEQTCKDFHLYIGDDCSPENLMPIISEFNDRLEFTYHRFLNNIGAKDIVKQWNRCVALAGGEKWVWVFSDDDIADPYCVESFYRALESESINSYDVYRFNTTMIDSEGASIVEGAESPAYEDSVTMAYELLMGRRGNSLPDHIFSKEKFDQYGGFVITDYGQGADWANSIKFSSEKGLYTIAGPRVHWRLSGDNISGNAAKNVRHKINGHLQFLTWVKKHFSLLEKKDNEAFAKIINACDYNLERVISYHFRMVSLRNVFGFYKYYQLYNIKENRSFLRVAHLYRKFFFEPIGKKILAKIGK